MHAVIAESGKQFLVRQGDTIQIDYRNLPPDEAIEFAQVLLVSDGAGAVRVGTPVVPGVTVKASVVGLTAGKKIHVGTYRRRKNFRKHKGHRQVFTEVKITEIAGA